jgi:hypothetical protein
LPSSNPSPNSRKTRHWWVPASAPHEVKERFHWVARFHLNFTVNLLLQTSRHPIFQSHQSLVADLVGKDVIPHKRRCSKGVFKVIVSIEEMKFPVMFRERLLRVSSHHRTGFLSFQHRHLGRLLLQFAWQWDDSRKNVTACS